MFVADDEETQAQVQRQLARPRSALADAWQLTDEVVLVGAGPRVPIPGRRDRTYPFHAHLEYVYLTDRERPGGVLAFDPGDGWTEFVTPVTRDERLWEGAGEHEPVGTTPIDELAGWLERRSGRPVALLGAPVEQAPEHDAEVSERLRRQLNELRRPKDELELERMRHAERATAAGFAKLSTPAPSTAPMPATSPARTRCRASSRPSSASSTHSSSARCTPRRSDACRAPSSTTFTARRSS
jgi:hypothetical protein